MTQSETPTPPVPAGRPAAPGGEPEPQRLAGSVVRITYQNPENGYCVVKLDPEGPVDPRHAIEGGLIAVVGVLPGIEIGQTIQLEGEWGRDPKYGPQFRAKWFKPSLPTGPRGMEVYLSSGAVKGIGSVTARRIVARFGEETFDVLDHHIERLREVPGIGRKTLQRIKAEWAQARGDRELVTFLGEHGVSPAIAARLRKTYGEAALSIVRSNPYRLTADVRGIGFMRADAIAQKMGLAPDAPERIDAALAHVLERQAEEGHTYLPRPRLEELAEELLRVPREGIAGRLGEMIEKEKVAVETMVGAASGEGETAVFITSLHEAERRLAEKIRRLLASPKNLPRVDAVAALADFEQRTRFRLAPAQREAVLALARGGMLILTGGPGTGKTTTVRSIIELFRLGRLTVKLAAPTGRAARRLSETARLPAETIHRLLNYQAHLGRFGRDTANPIEADLVIVDEASMLDAPLAASLLDAIHPRTCLVLVGDEDQLPSVGPGNVLGDLMAAAVMPVARLTEIFRQAGESLIVTNAHRINRGLMPYLKPPEPAPGREPDFFFIEREDPFQAIDVIKTLVRERIPRKFHLDPHEDIQILTPMRRGDLGVEALNDELRRLLNPRAGAAGTAAANPGASGGRPMPFAA
ncbi:MAG: AAA family ATPase, partial [bacterium]|nr:AAA family ATPase [bacterium]